MVHQGMLTRLVAELVDGIERMSDSEMERQLGDAVLSYHRSTLRKVVEQFPHLGTEEQAVRTVSGHVAELIRKAARALPRMVEAVDNPMENPVLRLALYATVVYAASPSDLVPDALGAEGFVDDAILVHRVIRSLPWDANQYLGVEPVQEEYLMLMQLAIDPALIPPLRQRLEAVGAQVAAAQLAGPWAAQLLLEQFLQPVYLEQFIRLTGDTRTDLPAPLPGGPTAGWSNEFNAFPDGGGFCRTESGWFIYD